MTSERHLPIEVDWMLDDLVERTGAECAAALSTDGMLIQKTHNLSKDDADQLAAMASSLSGVAQGTARHFAGGTVQQTIVEMTHYYLLVTAAGQNACLALLVGADADLGMVGYQMSRLVTRVSEHLASRQRRTEHPSQNNATTV